MKVVNFFLAVVFVLFAFVQVNDPDPVIWILIYGAMAVICVLAMFSFYPRKFLIGLLVLFVLYGLVFIPGVIEWLKQDNKSELFDEIAKMRHPYIEETREFLGLFICIAVLVLQLVRAEKLRKT
jgi:hypothetical protein